MSIEQSGFRTTYTGLLRNVRAVERSNQDKSKKWMENILDLEHQTADGRPLMVEIKLSKAAAEANMFAQLRTLVGKQITFDVYTQERVWQNAIYRDYYFTQKELPKVLDDSNSAIPPGVVSSRKVP